MALLSLSLPQVLKDEEERANYDYMLDNPGNSLVIKTHAYMLHMLSLSHTHTHYQMRSTDTTTITTAREWLLKWMSGLS